jgi:hypothetical protein
MLLGVSSSYESAEEAEIAERLNAEIAGVRRGFFKIACLGVLSDPCVNHVVRRLVESRKRGGSRDR